MKATPEADQQVAEWLAGFARTQICVAAVELGLVAALDDAPRTCESLATALDVHEASLRRLLRSLQAHGIVACDEGRYTLSPAGEALRSPMLDGWARLIAQPWIWNAWGQLAEAVRSGRPGIESSAGASFWEIVEQQPAAEAALSLGMDALSWQDARFVAPYVPLPEHGWIADLGGGHGIFLEALLARASESRGLLFDRPATVRAARDRIRSSRRCLAVGGDFFEWVPAGCVLYILKRVLQDWDDDHAVRLLHRCRAAMEPESRLILVERLLRDPPRPSATIADLSLLACVEGRVRQLPEIESLLQTADLSLLDVIDTDSDLSVLHIRT